MGIDNCHEASNANHMTRDDRSLTLHMQEMIEKYKQISKVKNIL